MEPHAPPPMVPYSVIATTAARYAEGYERMTGRLLSDWYGA